MKTRRSKLNFALRVLGLALALFVVWPLVSRGYGAILAGTASALRGLLGRGAAELTAEKNSYLYIPVVAVVLAASGLTWREKLQGVGLAFAALFSFDLLNLTFGLAGSGAAGSVTTSLYRALVWALPVFLMLLILEGRPSRLWGRPSSGGASS